MEKPAQQSVVKTESRGKWKMKNVYDIRYEQNLIYVRSSDQDILPQRIADEIYQDTVIMFYLYYEDTLSVYWPYIDGIPEEIDVCLIDRKSVV